MDSQSQLQSQVVDGVVETNSLEVVDMQEHTSTSDDKGENVGASPRKRVKKTLVSGVASSQLGKISGKSVTGNDRSYSEVWLSFHKPKLDKDTGKEYAHCKYCPAKYVCNQKRHGTSSLLGHIKRCLQHPKYLEAKKQKTLSFQTRSDGKSTLTTCKFDQKAIREALCKMIILDELPFNFVVGEGFKLFMSVCCPLFQIPSRTTMNRDTYHYYLAEKQRLKNYFKSKLPRISLTTDTWTSNQQINYMCLTAHFIDDEWKLHKKVINFCPITSHKGEDIGKGLERCLVDWGIDRIMCITVDNASSNLTAIAYLRKKLSYLPSTICQGKFIHMRCIAHIINLVVDNGLKMFVKSIDKVRAAVRFVRQSPARVQKFKTCIKNLDIKSKSFLCLDVPTRWNSCYLMLKSACILEKAFEAYDEEDPNLKFELNSKIRTGETEPIGMLCDDDWFTIKRFMQFLEHFYELTVRVSGSSYVTSNMLLDEISDTYAVLSEAKSSFDENMVQMASRMKDKFDKYWGGDEDNMNLLIFIARVFDPRHKLDFVLYVVDKMYPFDVAKKLSAAITKALNDLFNDYSRIYYVTSSHLAAPQANTSASGVVVKPKKGLLSAEFKKFKTIGDGNVKSELDRFLKEDLEEDTDAFDLLVWWKNNSQRLPILSRMARDILAIPISTVASESVFSTGGRVLNDFRSNLTPRIVQSLICTQDWIRNESGTWLLESELDELEEVEEELANLNLEQILHI